MQHSEMICNWINTSSFFLSDHISLNLTWFGISGKISMIAFKNSFLWEENYKQLKLPALYLLTQGSYRQVCVKFKDISRTSKRLSYCFQGLKTCKNTNLHVKILFLKC